MAIGDLECVGCGGRMRSGSMPLEAQVPLCSKCRPSTRAVACLDGDVECCECGCRFSDAYLGVNGIAICAHCAWGIEREQDVILLAVRDELHAVAE